MRSTFFLLLLSIFFSCTKTEVKPSIAETNGVLLAGSKGSSKSWQMTSLTVAKNSGSAQTVPLDACQSDNVFKFTNDDTQSFEHTEGLTKCVSTDSTLVEKGSWAFTTDGKKLIMDVIPYSNQYLFSLSPPGSVTSLTETNLACYFDYVDGTDTYRVTFGFSKK